MAFAVVAMLALVVGLSTLGSLTLGDVDPLGAAIGFASLLVGIASLVVAVRAWRLQQADTALLTKRLAGLVLSREQQARRQLLGGAGDAIDVVYDLYADGARRPGRLSQVADHYRALQPRRMMVAGEAGAGKTVLAVELIMMLLEARADGDPVPVRLSASSWDPGTVQMPQWLAAHLVQVYRLPPRSAQALVDAGLVLPVVDGLDELDATERPGYESRAAQALRMFNAYELYRGKAPLIVTCRTGHLRALVEGGNRLADAAHLEIRRLSPEQMRQFVTSRAAYGRRWWPVLERIDRDPYGALATGLATPWRLTLAVTVYEQRGPGGEFPMDPGRLTDPALNTAEKVRDHLLAMFVPATLRSVTGVPYDAARVQRWLSVLAGHLNRNRQSHRGLGGRRLSGTDIAPHELWPIAGRWLPRALSFTLLLPFWLYHLYTYLDELLDSPSFGSALLVGLLFTGIWRTWSRRWPKPRRADPAQLRTPAGRLRLILAMVGGLGLGLQLALEGLTHISPSGLLWDAGEALGQGLLFGLTLGLVLGLMDGGPAATASPRSIIQNDIALTLVFGAAFGIRSWIVTAYLSASGDLHEQTGVLASFGSGFRFGVLIALASGTGIITLRYAAMLLLTRRVTRRWLPWRLGRFLDACHRAGLLRIAGAGYQFRHRELQDYVAAHPA
ncbi:hypothetical protein BJ973_002969 [Actinoplanes tereljensis]|uniref:NACHT domain-containing protein n=1 Tax=Paractinoplanes tereljensis TaxID=571912 RepID=A0A919NQU4_9ACTN|nr:NACHT domain-containing protein [Actinoplanes tereljensis]GIF22648.1 hypothetical protein Ate02nite_53780 [Actinoplanes tereljensis]